MNVKFFLRPAKDSKGGTYYKGYARGMKVQLFEADGKTGIEYTLSMQTPQQQRRYSNYRPYRNTYGRPYRAGYRSRSGAMLQGPNPRY